MGGIDSVCPAVEFCHDIFAHGHIRCFGSDYRSVIFCATLGGYRPQEARICTFRSFFHGPCPKCKARSLFLLPMLVWYWGYGFSKDQHFDWKAAGDAFAAIMLGTLFNILLEQVYCSDKRLLAMQSNFAYVLLALASGGKEWNYYEEYFPYLYQNNDHIASLLYMESIQIILSKPWMLLIGVLKNFLSFINYVIDSYIHILSNFISFKSYKGSMVSIFLMRISGAITFIIFIYQMKKRYDIEKKYMGILILVLASMVLSALIVWIVDEIRIFTATMPFLIASLAIAFGKITANNQIKNTSINIRALLSLLLGAIITASLILFPLCRKHDDHKWINKINCNNSDNTVFLVKKPYRAPHIILMDDDYKRSFVPRVRIEDYKQSIIRRNCSDTKLFLDILNTKYKDRSGVAFFYDYLSPAFFYVVGPEQIFNPKFDTLKLFTSKYKVNNNVIYRVEKFEVLSTS